MVILATILGVLFGCVLGWAVGLSLSKAKLVSLETEKKYGDQRLTELGETLQRERTEFERQRGDYERQRLEQQQQWQAQWQEQLKRFEELRLSARLEFEKSAQSLFEAKTKSFTEQNNKSMEQILKPLQERLQGFEKKVDDSYQSEARERFALKGEIERLIGVNEKMRIEARSLTDVLRGDSKAQGDWGELILEKILESSGLREGIEYATQGSYEGEGGGRFRPDVLIHLPEGKHLIVDSKVSLSSYEEYRRLTQEGSQPENAARVLKEHLASIDAHINGLADKHYQKLKGVNSPEFVFLFVAVEPAYLTAMQADPEISTRAWRKGIALVTSTTLLTSLRTVGHIWRLDNQNKNALEIAQEAAKMYDKFVGFVDDFDKIGKLFDDGQKYYHTALGKLKDGPGNVFRKMELLRELGAAPTKKLKAELTE